MKPTPYKILTHDDLDGIVSAMVMERILEDMGIKSVPQFTSVYNAPRNLADSLSRRVHVAVTDLHVPPADLKKCLGADGRICWEKDIEGWRDKRLIRLPLVVDHHKESVEAYTGMSWSYVSDKAAASLLCLNLARKMSVSVSPELERLAFLANDYDMWIHNDPESKRLNVVFTLLGAEGAFFWLKANPSDWMFDGGEWYLAEQKRKVSEALERIRIEERPGGHSLGVLAHDPDCPLDVNDVNEIASEITAERVRCFIYIYEPSQDTYGRTKISFSFRSRQGTSHASEMLEAMRPHLKSGGGHDSACGGSILGKVYTSPQQVIDKVIVPSFESMVRRGQDNSALSSLGLDDAVPMGPDRR